jgi:ubiquinone/menaquinone biosynthesis C-methylase UbiE
MHETTPQARAAATYHAAADRYDALPFWARYGRRTVERLGLPAGAAVLDVCCGSGASALPAAEIVGPTGRVLALDLAEGLLALGRAKAARLGLGNIRFERGDLAEVDDRLADFDAVVCVFGIFFLPDMAGAVARLWQRVRPGGVLAITTWGPRVFEPVNSAFWDSLRKEAPALYKGFRPWDRIAEPEGLGALFGEAGVPGAEVVAEAGTEPLETPEGWWTVVLGSGYRGTVEQLTDEQRHRVHQATVRRLEAGGTRAIETNVLYGVARR